MDECSRLQSESRMDDQHGHSQGFYFSMGIHVSSGAFCGI